MALVTVQQRNSSYKKIINTDDYVFDNNVPTGSAQFNPAEYAIVKVGRTYYINDGQPFDFTGPTSSAILQKIEYLYLDEALVKGAHKIKIGVDPVYGEWTGTRTYTPIQTSDWAVEYSIPGYGVSGKALIGIFSRDTSLTSAGGFRHAGGTQTYYGDIVESPLYWRFAPGKPFVIASNFTDQVCGYQSTTETLDGYAEQPWEITSGSWGREEVNRADDSSYSYWQGGSTYLQVASAQADKDGGGHSYTSGGWYYWHSKYTHGNRKVEIGKYSVYNTSVEVKKNTNTNRIRIKNSSGTIKNFDFKDGQRVVLVKRKLVSLQDIIDSEEKRRFFLIYCTSSYLDNRILLPAFTRWPNLNAVYFAGQADAWTSSMRYLFNTAIWEKGYFSNWQSDVTFDSFQTGKHEVNVNVTLPDFEFYDITNYLKNNTVIVPADITEDASIGTRIQEVPIWFNDVFKHHEEQTYVFNFTESGSSGALPIYATGAENGIYTHGGVQYNIKVNNIYTLGESIDTSTPVRDAAVWNHLIDKDVYTSENGSTISASLVVKDIFKWNTPPWFSDHFVNLAYNGIGIAWTGETWRPTEIGLIYNGFGYYNDDGSYNKYGYVEQTDSFNESFHNYYGVAGWNQWFHKGYVHVAPVETSFDEGFTTNIQGVYGAVMSYLFPYANSDNAGINQLTYYDYQHVSSKNPLGVQIGFTTGILINYPGINVFGSATTYGGWGVGPGIPTTDKCSYAIIICDEYAAGENTYTEADLIGSGGSGSESGGSGGGSGLKPLEPFEPNPGFTPTTKP